MAIANYYRSDGWVKTVQGPAVPGAQVYVCTQPANVTPPITPPRTTPVPWQGPNPQAQIFSDDGITPIVQPIITDGFGHYDFYVFPGLYTVVIMFGGKVQQFYIDQSIGNVGSTQGSSVVFSTNSTPNFNQLVQNLVQGPGTTIVTDNFGNTTISVSGSGLMLKTNGVVNGSQTLQNLVNGNNISITQDGVGNVTIADTLTESLPSPDVSRFALWQVSPVGSLGWITLFDAVNFGGGTTTQNLPNAAAGPSITLLAPVFNNVNSWNGAFQFWPGRRLVVKTTGFISFTGAPDGVMYWGLSDRITGSGPTDPTTGDSILIRASAASGSLATWAITSSIGGVASTAVSGVPIVSGQRYSLEMIVDAGVATLFVDGASVVTQSSLPTANALAIVLFQKNTSLVGSWTITTEYIYACTATP